MNQVDQNINKDMIDSELIDVNSLDLSDDQTWLYTVPGDTGNRVDIIDWNLSCDWPVNEDSEYIKTEKEIYTILDTILKNDILAMPDKHKFDSRTYIKPKKRPQRPSIQSIVETPSMSPTPPFNQSTNKYLTYNKYNMPLGPISPMLRLKTFNVDVNTDNSSAIKEYAMKRRSLVQDEDPQLEDVDITLCSDTTVRLSMEGTPSKPINIDLSQPANNLHNTFNKGLTNIINERGSLNMYQSGESLMRMSPPSLVSSMLMENSGTFHHDDEQRKSITMRDSGPPTLGRESIDPMMTSMTLSILDEKDMSTSFLSQTTYPDNDSLMDSLPPSLVSSVNSSYIVNSSRPRNDDSNIFSSATFTHLEHSEKLLSARPRYQPFITKRDSIRNSESYTKSREEACQIDTTKVLNENSGKEVKESPKTVKPPAEMTETVTLHYSNNRFSDAEKENFETDDAFYKDMGMQKGEDSARHSLNVTIGKQELNEIIQARQKLSLARKGLPEADKALPNQADLPIKTIQLPNQTITVPRQSMENASELLSRRRALANGGTNGFEKHEEREAPKRSLTFKKTPPPKPAMDATVVYVKPEENHMIDINSATLSLIDSSERPQEEWGSQERAMVGSSESTDTGTFSSSSPPESVPDTAVPQPNTQIASTPLMSLRKGARHDLLNLHTTISPIYDMLDDKSYTVTKAPSNVSAMERTYDMHNTTVINSATMVKKPSVKRDILAEKGSPDNKLSVLSPPTLSPTSKLSYGSMVPPTGVPRKSSLPTSKLRQYSSHRELSRIPGTGTNPVVGRSAAGRGMARRGVYGSNPALSPTAPAPPEYALAPKPEDKYRPTVLNPPPLVRQGTETLRRERPQSQLVAPKDPPTIRPYSVVGATQLRVARPASGPVQKPATVSAVVDQPRPASSAEPRASGLPRPSRLPAPRRTLRPPSVYTAAPAGDEHY